MRDDGVEACQAQAVQPAAVAILMTVHRQFYMGYKFDISDYFEAHDLFTAVLAFAGMAVNQVPP